MTPDLSSSSVRPLVTPEIVSFPTQLDASNSMRVSAQLFGACRPDVPVVIADLTYTESCDSGAIRYLVAAHDQAQLCGVELRIVIRSAQVRSMLELTGADLVLSVYPDMADALTGHVPRRPRTGA